MRLVKRCAAIAAFSTIALFAADEQPPSLRAAHTIALGAGAGPVGPLATDDAGGMLFAAVPENNSVEVADLRKGTAVRSLTGIAKPAGLVYVAARHRLYVSSGSGIEVIDPATGNRDTRIELGGTAGSLAYDAGSHRIFAGTPGALAVVDPASGRKFSEVKLSGDPAGILLESTGPRIFVNVPSQSAVAVIDRAKLQVTSTIPVAWGKENTAIAIDEKNKRLFVTSQTPAKLLVLDTASLQWITEVVLPDNTGDVFYDAGLHQVLVLSGTAKVPGFAGVVTAMLQMGPDHYKIIGQPVTSQNARSAAWWAAGRQLLVGAPANQDHGAEILAFEIK
jgi:DNA-binding beta-propeller fold protein YncE